MTKLIQTPEYSIIRGPFGNESEVELFRCPRSLDNTDLRRYVNEYRCVLGMEATNVKNSLKEEKGYCGYFRMYYRNGSWNGRWMEATDGVHRITIAGVQEVINWFVEQFPGGCDYCMRDYLKAFPTWNPFIEQRYLLAPLYSDRYKVMIDTTFGNGDYPVRIYCYELDESEDEYEKE